MLKETKILQVILLKDSKEQSKSGSEYLIRILEKGGNGIEKWGAKTVGRM